MWLPDYFGTMDFSLDVEFFPYEALNDTSPSEEEQYFNPILIIQLRDSEMNLITQVRLDNRLGLRALR